MVRKRVTPRKLKGAGVIKTGTDATANLCSDLQCEDESTRRNAVLRFLRHCSDSKRNGKCKIRSNCTMIIGEHKDASILQNVLFSMHLPMTNISLDIDADKILSFFRDQRSILVADWAMAKRKNCFSLLLWSQSSKQLLVLNDCRGPAAMDLLEILCLARSKKFENKLHISITVHDDFRKVTFHCIVTEKGLSSPEQLMHAGFSPVTDWRTVLKIVPINSLLGDDDDCSRNTSAIERVLEEDIQNLYDALFALRPSSSCDVLEVQHAALVPILRDYQSDAVRWMLSREHQPSYNTLAWQNWLAGFQKLRHCQQLMLHKLSGQLIKTEEFVQLQSLETPCRGGILADEMGLGKTVETLALILQHPRPKFGTVPNIRNVQLSCGNREVLQLVTELVSNVAGTLERDQALKITTVLKSNSRKRRFQNSSAQNGKCKSGKTSGKVPANGAVSCLCSASDERKAEMMQCAECRFWQHASCINWPSDQLAGSCHYTCTKCIEKLGPIQSGATIVISPASIAYQWYEEAVKHVKSHRLKILVYTGAAEGGFVHPALLASNDLVICTYETLRTEIHFATASQNGNRRELQGLVRFLHLPPLDNKFWFDRMFWRPYIQCVADGKSLDRCEAVRILAQFVWRNEKSRVAGEMGVPPQETISCVASFTPIEQHFYSRLRQQQIVAARKVLALNLPVFGEIAAMRGFDSVEELPMALLPKWALDVLTAPLHNLRKACVHPEISTRGRFTALELSNNEASLSAVLLRMVQSEVNLCSDAQRRVSATYNGMAGVHWLNGDWPQAAHCYREALRSAKKHLRQFGSVDKLPRVHALHNLAVLLENPERRALIPPTLEDDQLPLFEAGLRDEIVSDSWDSLCRESNKLRAKTEEAMQAWSKCSSDGSQPTWYVSVCNNVDSSTDEPDLLAVVRRTADSASIVGGVNFASARALGFALSRHVDSLAAARGCCIAAVGAALRPFVTAAPGQDENAPSCSRTDGNENERCLVVKSAAACHLRANPGAKVKKDIGKCTVCAIRAELNKYEPLLVNMRQRTQVQHGTDLDDALDTSASDLAGADMEGNWLPTKQEGALKAILLFARGRLERSVVEQGVRHLRAMDLYRKEWRAMVHVWMALDGLVAKMDEVDIALERFVLADDEQRRQLKRPLNHLHPWELAPKMTELKDDLTTAERDLEYHLHQHKYLKGLQQQQEAGPSEDGNSISIDCVVCMTSLDSRWAVLLCGHQGLGLPQLCCECLEVLMRRHSIHGDGGSCPMCRRKTDWVNVHYVIAQGAHAGCAGNDGNDFDARFCDPAVPVEGNFSTKITWVTRTLKTISLRRRRDKSVVFSHWPAVLDMLSAAFSRNGLPHLCMHRAAGPLNRQSILSQFKSDPDCNILLMTLASGGRGLNLTEAQHVLLVERANCAALERQAAGRVHRTGQRRPTFVHTFMIRSTVEHRLAETVDKSVSKQDNDNKTIGGSDHDSTATIDAAPQITLKQFAQLFEVERLLGD